MPTGNAVNADIAVSARIGGTWSCHTHEAELKLGPTDDGNGQMIGRVALQRDLVRVANFNGGRSAIDRRPLTPSATRPTG
jgi:hypothetical protein